MRRAPGQICLHPAQQYILWSPGRIKTVIADRLVILGKGIAESRRLFVEVGDRIRPVKILHHPDPGVGGA